jgi:hypothetical protein
MTSPYSVYSANGVVIAEKVLAKIETAPFGTFTTPPQYFAYGDQEKIPQVPAVCVELGDKARELEGAPNMTLNEFEVFILVYHMSAERSATEVRKEVDNLAYEIERWLHSDLQLTLGNPTTPALIHGYVRINESGYAFKNSTLYRSARLVYVGRNKTSLAES